MWVNGVHGLNVLLVVVKMLNSRMVAKSVIGLHLERLRMAVRHVCTISTKMDLRCVRGALVVGLGGRDAVEDVERELQLESLL